ncbi:hypothetical protein [Amycolatopsis magusensis]|uniref:hypothetical protein n=1 Tax=Amycolatopsis magusensis TaxID=882444 RepID=UPI003797594E
MARVPKLSLQFLGDDYPAATVDGREVPITLRHAEILTLLALYPGGLSADKLAWQLYGDAGDPVTVRAEIHRLRGQLGPDAVRTRPYRLGAEVDADFLRARNAARRGEVAEFAVPLLPESESPALREERESLTALVRHVLLANGGAETLSSCWDTSCGVDDHALLGALAQDDPRRSLVHTHRARLG